MYLSLILSPSFLPRGDRYTPVCISDSCASQDSESFFWRFAPFLCKVSVTCLFPAEIKINVWDIKKGKFLGSAPVEGPGRKHNRAERSEAAVGSQ